MEKKSTAAQIENVRSLWMELDYQSKVALSLHFNDNLEKVEETAQPGQPKRRRPRRKTRPRKPTRPRPVSPQGHLEELVDVPISKESEEPAPTQRLAEGMTSTPAKRPRTADCSQEEGSFTTVQRKKKEGKHQFHPGQGTHSRTHQGEHYMKTRGEENQTNQDPTPSD